jgi:hypothetical protein
MSSRKKALPMEELIAARRLLGDAPRKGPKKAPRKTVNDSPRHAKTCSCHPVIRLPARTLACAHGWDEVCERCVEGIAGRAMYRAALTRPRRPRVLRIDAWRASSDGEQRRAAGMQELKTTMAEVQRQMMLHANYVCDGCVHCKENSNAEA